MNKIEIEAVVRDELHTLLDFVRWGASSLSKADVFLGHGTQFAVDEALAIVLHCVHLSHAMPESYLNARLTLPEKQLIYVMIKTRIETRKPLPYLTHEAHFADLSFYVDERVLIPRSPLAELIENQFDVWLSSQDVNRVLDLCTGSGCIGIACAFAFPDADVDVSDIYADALVVAEKNIQHYQLSGRVNKLQSDLFDQIPAEKQYDLIIANPPYVSHQEMTQLPLEYSHEPDHALRSGEDGLDCVTRILQQAALYLSDQGVLVVEVGNSEQALIEKYPEAPFCWVEFERGGHGVFVLRANQLAAF